jgi:hypothetical protein
MIGTYSLLPIDRFNLVSFPQQTSNSEEIMANRLAHIAYHVLVVLMSAALALYTPYALSAMAAGLLRAWAFIENEKIFLIALEIVTAIILILFFNSIRRGWENRRITRMAKSVGLVQATMVKGMFAQRRMKKMKKQLGFARELMIIGSSGYRTFVDPDGDLHEALQNCREAKIMLLNPFKEGAVTRARAIPDPEVTPGMIREQIIKSIDFLKGLRAAQREVRLKLYPDLPLLKLAIIGDYAFLQHYHTGMNVRHMPEYAFKNESQHGGLYIPLYRYFLTRWQDTAIPEYDLDTDELIYRDVTGNEVAREQFHDRTNPTATDTEPGDEPEELRYKTQGAFVRRTAPLLPILDQNGP